MAAVYPGGVKTWTDVADGTDDILDHHVNDLYAEVIAIETSLLNYTLVPDPFTRLLMHFEGNNEGTTFTDEKTHTISAGGNTCTKTAVKKFGSSSAYFDGNGDSLYTTGAGFTFGMFPFTVDGWYYPTSVDGYQTLFDTLENGGAGSRNYSFLCCMNAGKIKIFTKGSFIIETATGLTANEWNHVAVVRLASEMRIYLNGTLVGSVAFVTDVISAAFKLGTNSDVGSYPLIGYIDELRVSQGVARWSCAFTPPTKAYTDVLLYG